MKMYTKVSNENCGEPLIIWFSLTVEIYFSYSYILICSGSSEYVLGLIAFIIYIRRVTAAALCSVNSISTYEVLPVNFLKFYFV